MQQPFKSLLAICLIAGLALVLAASATAQYSQVARISYAGVETDRGFAVNANPGSPYNGYIYAVDPTPKVIRVLRPEPADAGANAASYVDTGAQIAYASPPATFFLMNCFVGPDDTVWVVDYHGKQICTGPAEGGDLTPQFATTNKARSVFVNQPLGTDGMLAYVAESDADVTPWIDRCEIFQYSAASGTWTKLIDLGNLGLIHPFSVTLDDEGNSYWVGVAVDRPNVVKVRPDFTIDSSWVLNIPDFCDAGWTPHSISYVKDPDDPVNPEYLYISAGNYNGAPNMVLRFDMSGNYIDGFGQTWMMQGTPPEGTYVPIDVSQPGGNNFFYMSVDDKHNIYLICKQYVNNVYTPYVIKMHLPYRSAPSAPTNVEASNDIYGQIRLKWTESTMPSVFEEVSGYNIYRSTDTTKPAEIYASTADNYPKWKDAAQGQDAGTFYYWVSAFSPYGESEATGPIGPVSTTASTAPPPRSKGVALSYSEFTSVDVGEVWTFDQIIDRTKQFLDDRGVPYTMIWDADPSQANIENDDLAGHSLLILPANRDMTYYTAQCIKDYVKYSGGRAYSMYWNAAANHKQVTQPDFLLADIYRCHNSGWDGDFDDWRFSRFRYMRPVTGAPGADVLFAGLPDGVVQPGSGTMSMICLPYTDGTAVVAGEWYSGDRTSQPYPTGDPKNTALIIGYVDGEPRSVYATLHWWYRIAEDGYNGTFTATKFSENVLTFFGIPFTPIGFAGHEIGYCQKNYGDGTNVAFANAVVTEVLYSEISPNRHFYIESQDRTAGIKVDMYQPAFYGMMLVPGQIVSLSGVMESEWELNPDMSTTWGDRIVRALEIFPSGTTDTLKPFYMANSSVVGPWTANGVQQGAYEGPGVNNLGLYVKISGKVTYIDNSAEPFFYVDDGSGLQDGTKHFDGTGAEVPNVGVRVIAPWWNYLSFPPDGFAEGKYVSVSGCTALELVGIGGANGVRAIRFGDWNSVTLHN